MHQPKHLSKAGKEILIKSCAQAIPSHCMSIFLLPASLEDQLQKMMNSSHGPHCPNQAPVFYDIVLQGLFLLHEYPTNYSLMRFVLCYLILNMVFFFMFFGPRFFYSSNDMWYWNKLNFHLLLHTGIQSFVLNSTFEIIHCTA